MVMGDFSKILDEWEHHRQPQGHRTSDSRVGSGKGDFEAWLDRYPPEDKDATVVEPDDEHRPNPESLPVDDSIDLHGYRLADALAATDAFIKRSVERGYRKVVVIHGKGRDGKGVLRREVKVHLERHPMTGAMGYGRGIDGGRGALWVILRRWGR